MQPKDYLFLPLLLGSVMASLAVVFVSFKAVDGLWELYPDYNPPTIHNFWWGVIAAVVIHFSKDLSTHLFYPFFLTNIDEKYTGKW